VEQKQSMLYNYFRVESVRDDKQKAEFSAGNLVLEEEIIDTTKGKELKLLYSRRSYFKNYKFRNEYVIKMLKNYCYLNTGLTIIYNGEKFFRQWIERFIR
jgi:topoisomerase-4 subunit B